MKNVLILGCGRSGTSLVAGCLAKAGYNIGDDYIVNRESNPKGFFEDSQVNRINDEIIQRSYPKKPPFSGEWVLNDYDWDAERWLVRIPLNARLFCSEEINIEINNILKKKPFCYKDTRFGYTFPVWKPFLKNTVFIVVFRNPFSTALSILRECRNEKYLKNMELDFETSLEIWILVYSHILKHYKESKDKKKWMFIHYNQMFKKKFLDKLKKFTGAQIDYDFPDKKLNRTKSNMGFSEDVEDIYKELCRLASYKGRG